MAFFSFSFTSVCVLPRTFLMIAFPVLGSRPTVYRPPSAVLSFADVPFPVRSSFRHGISPFRNEQYRNQGNKATGKPNCYQKVIICTSEPRRLIFDYCGAIFALPGASSLFIARQILNRLLCRLFVFISVKVKPFLAYTSSTCFLISGLMRKRNISVLGAVTMFSTSDGPVKIYAQNCLQAPAE